MVNLLIVGFFIVLSLLVLWFFSPLKLTLGKFFFNKEILSQIEFDDMLFLKNKILSKVLSCWICLSFWLSLLVGIVLVFCFSLPYYFPILTFLTYPGICYFFYTKIK